MATPRIAMISRATPHPEIIEQQLAGTARLLKGTWPMFVVNPDVLAGLPARATALNT